MLDIIYNKAEKWLKNRNWQAIIIVLITASVCFDLLVLRILVFILITLAIIFIILINKNYKMKLKMFDIYTKVPASLNELNKDSKKDWFNKLSNYFLICLAILFIILYFYKGKHFIGNDLLLLLYSLTLNIIKGFLYEDINNNVELSEQGIIMPGIEMNVTQWSEIKDMIVNKDNFNINISLNNGKQLKLSIDKSVNHNIYEIETFINNKRIITT